MKDYDVIQFKDIPQECWQEALALNMKLPFDNFRENERNQHNILNVVFQ